MSVKVLPPYINRVPSLKFVRELTWIAQKKRLGALKAMQKNSALYKVLFLKKSRIPAKNAYIIKKYPFWGHYFGLS